MTCGSILWLRNLPPAPMKNLRKNEENQQIHRAGGESGLWEEGIVSLRSKLVFGETSPPSHQIRETETHPRKQERSRLAASGGWTELVRRPERAPACFKEECRVACQCVFARVCECFELVLTPYVFSLQINEVQRSCGVCLGDRSVRN